MHERFAAAAPGRAPVGVQREKHRGTVLRRDVGTSGKRDVAIVVSCEHPAAAEVGCHTSGQIEGDVLFERAPRSTYAERRGSSGGALSAVAGVDDDRVYGGDGSG